MPITAAAGSRRGRHPGLIVMSLIVLVASPLTAADPAAGFGGGPEGAPEAAGGRAGASGMAPPITPPKIPFEKYTLPNGLDVVLHEDHTAPVAAVTLWYHVGSKNEVRGRTGLAHLFEHLMFEGSQHHPMAFDKTLEPLGALSSSANTWYDRTNFFDVVPSNALEVTLWLEADRMGWFLPALTQERLENQKEVVKNERRQTYENEPYGLVGERMYAALYPPDHPYSWDVIGSMEDIGAATKEDAGAFFREFYGPNNCTLVVAGDIEPARTKAFVAKYFAPIPPGPPAHRVKEWIPEQSSEIRLSMEDPAPLPRLSVAWHAPGLFRPGEADLRVLAGILALGRNSRLHKRLVYDLKAAQEVTAYHEGREIAGLFVIEVTAAPGHTLDEIEPVVLEEIEKIKAAAPEDEEIERARTAILGDLVRGLDRIGGASSRAERLAEYNTYVGDPGYIEKDFARYEAVSPATVRAAAARWLHQGRVVVRVTPAPRREAAPEPEGFDRSVKPQVGPEPPPRPPSVRRMRLSNGLEVIVAESHRIPLVQIDLIVRGGRAADPKKRRGASSFVARMLERGTPSRTALQISDEAARFGAQLQSYCSLDTCTVGLSVLKARLDPALDLWADVVGRPAFPEEEIARLREEMLAEILQEKEDADVVAFRVLPALLYGEGHPYAQPFSSAGSEEGVKAIAREDLVAYHRTWFHPNNATLVVVGDVTAEEVVPRLEKVLADWKPGGTARVRVPERQQPERPAFYVIDRPGAVQTVLLAAHLMPPRSDPERPAFDVLNTILGGSFTSRINMNLRETKGYTYGAGASVSNARGQGVFHVYAAVRTDATRESIVELLKELRDIRGARPATEAELRDARSRLTRVLPGRYSTIAGIAGRLDEIARFGLPDNEDAIYLEKVRAATLESLTALAMKWILPEKLVWVAVGDRAAIETGISGLGLGPLIPLDADGRILPERNESSGAER